MKSIFLTLLAIAIGGFVFSSCKKSDDDNNNNNNNTIPDAVFSMNVSGAESHTFNFTLDKGTATDYVINGAHTSNPQQLQIGVMTLPVTWQYNLVADVSSLANGTYNLKEGVSTFANPDQTSAYMAVSGTLKITKATLYQDVSSVEDWFIDGEFTGVYQDNNTPPNQITVSGSFSGVNIKAQ